jgi:uncharacterized membrane protein
MTHPVHRSWLNLIHARQRLLYSVVIGVVLFFILPHSWRLTTRLVLSWDLLTLSYLLTTARLIARSTTETCRRRAALYDEGDWLILAITLVGAAVSFATIVMELAAGKAEGASLLLTFVITAVTVGLSWAFTHMIFALHYANLYYRADASGQHGGLIFPGQREPDYRDFVYYSFVIACAAQTADVSTVSPNMRRVTLIHCVTAFAFNSAILALMINITASLI